MKLSGDTPVLGFAAYSGTGKTTLLEQLITRLRERGLRLAIVKHSHHNFDIDQPGKDSYRLRKAGGAQTLIASKYRSVLIKENAEPEEPELEATLAMLDPTDIDLVLVEGFRHETRLPRIELHRPALGRPLLHRESENIIAIASDQPLNTDLPQLDLNQLDQIEDFILHWLEERSAAR